MIIITQATVEDADWIVSIVNEAYKVESFKRGNRTHREDVLKKFNDGVFLILCSNNDDGDVGVATLSPAHSTTSLTAQSSNQSSQQSSQQSTAQSIIGCVYIEVKTTHAYLGMLSIHPCHQGKGYSSRLLNSAEQFALQHNCQYIELHVISLRTELLTFYKKHLYELMNETIEYPRPELISQPCHFLVFRKLLKN